jgi:flagellar biosynthesis chaperone FliJ
MTMIKTWRERCEEHPDHEGIVSEQMIRNRMQEEIDELRQAIAEAKDAVAAEREACAELAVKGTDEPVQTKTLEILRKERERIAATIRARGQT